MTEGSLFAPLLLFLRLATALRLMPFFGGFPMPIVPWLALSAALSWVLAQAPVLTQSSLTWVQLIPLAFKEIFIGLVIGLLCRMAFSILEMTAQLARTSSRLFPDASEDGSLKTLYLLTGIAAFWVMDGHHHLISGLHATLACMPVDRMAPLTATPFSPAPVLVLFSTAFAAALFAAAPLFVAGLVADAVVAAVIHLTRGTATFGVHLPRHLFVVVLALVTLGAVVDRVLLLLRESIDQIASCGGGM
jgi:flagellar biosynthesis protein FliR